MQFATATNFQNTYIWEWWTFPTTNKYLKELARESKHVYIKYNSCQRTQMCKTRFVWRKIITSTGWKRGLREPLNTACNAADRMPTLPFLWETASCSATVPNRLSGSKGIGLNTVPCNSNQWIVQFKPTNGKTSPQTYLNEKKKTKYIGWWELRGF